VAPVGRHGAEALQVLDQTILIGQEIDGVAVRLGPVLPQIRITDVELTGDHRVPWLCHVTCPPI
jgi:hypothetical protein